MEGPGNKIIVLFLLLLSFELNASNQSVIYSAYINNNMDRWKEHIDKMDAVSLKSKDMIIELVNYQYGYIAWCIGNNKEGDAKKYLDKAEANLLILSEDNKNISLVNAYKAAFYGYRIGLNKILAPILGPKSVDCAKIAIVADKENPFAYVQYGNIQFYMPALFGGSKKEGLAYFKRAEELMGKNKDYTVGNWNYLSLLTVIAQSFSYLEDYDSAIAYLEKILKIEPDFDWVKNELYPQVLSKLKE